MAETHLYRMYPGALGTVRRPPGVFQGSSYQLDFVALSSVFINLLDSLLDSRIIGVDSRLGNRVVTTQEAHRFLSSPRWVPPSDGSELTLLHGAVGL